MYKKNEVRNSSIELLRIIMMMGVIILHYNNSNLGGGYRYVKEGSLNNYYLFFLNNLFVYAVDIFIMISGYFLCKTENRKSIRIVELIIQVIVFNYIAYIVGCLNGEIHMSMRGIVGCMFPVNYYVILYAVVYLLSPYINILIQSLGKDKFRKFVLLNFFIFSGYTILVDYAEKISGIKLNGLSSVGLYGSSAGYTIVNFFLCYIIGAYIRSIIITMNEKKVFVTMIVMIVLMNMITILEYKSGLGYGTAWNYNNPIVIINSACVLTLFFKMKIHNVVINELAKGAYTCFLFHGIVLKFYNIEKCINSMLVVLILHQLFTIITIYLMSYILYKIYNWIISPLIKCMDSLCRKIDHFLK